MRKGKRIAVFHSQQNQPDHVKKKKELEEEKEEAERDGNTVSVGDGRVRSGQEGEKRM